MKKFKKKKKAKFKYSETNYINLSSKVDNDGHF